MTTDDVAKFSCPVADFGKGGSSHSITCYQWGHPSSPTVLCVHGLTRNGRDFDYLAKDLAASHHVLCPDMPGRGNSDYLTDPAGYTYPAYVADIAALLKQLGITELKWVGTSMGGIIGMMFANAFPGVIKKMVLNDIGGVISATGLKRILSYASGKKEYATREEAEAAFRDRCRPFGIRDEQHWQHLFAHGFRHNPNGTLSFAYDPAILTGLPAAGPIEDIDLWALWQGVTSIPILLIRGSESDILTHETAIEMQQRHTNLTLCELPGIGHAPSLMTPDQVALINEWLQ